MSTDALHEQKQILASLARLNNTPDFDRFMQYIASLLAEYIQFCISAEDPARPQGAAQVLQRIQKEVKEAEAAFMKLTGQAEIPL